MVQKAAARGSIGGMNTTADRLTASGSPFEVAEAIVEGVPCRVFRHGPRTLLDIYRRASSCGDRVFLVSGGRRATYNGIFRLSERILRAIRRTLGVTEGARIAVVFDNVPEWIASFVAVTSLGATVVAVHRTSPWREMLSAIEMVDCAMVICGEQLAGALSREVNGGRVVAVDAMGGLIGAIRSEQPADDADGATELTFGGSDSICPESLAMIAFTSGSTGRPKGVELTHRSMTCGMMNALLGGALAAAGAEGVVRSASHLPPAPFLAAPFSHVSGYCTALLSMYLGGRIVTMERWDPARAVELMLSEQATSLIGATAEMLGELLLEDDLRALAGFVRSVVAQGTALPQSLLRELKSALPRVSLGVGYGLTETNGSICMGSETMLRDRPGTSGKTLPTVDLKILCDDGKDAAPGQVGEVVVRGAMLMRGYLDMPDLTRRVLRDGWLRTGDRGWRDSEGCLYLADRAEHFIVCGGVKVPCSAVERVVLDNGLATEAVAFGSGGGDQGEGLLLAVVSHARGSSADDSAIVAALRRAGYGAIAPRIVRLGTSVPKTPSGKIDRRELRRRVLAGELPQ